MPKIIFTSRYMKNNSKEHMENFIQYLATRPGAEHYSPSLANKKSTAKQIKWIEQQLKKYPEAKETFEHDDYLKNPTVSNASELIIKISELALESGNDMENYIGYLANRPGAESFTQGHALWNGSDDIIDLNKVKKETAEHTGYIWTHVVSLRREDATRLGFENPSAWRELVKSKIPSIAENMKIPSENLVWYAAFHNESYHPHIHLMVYSKKAREGYLTNKGIENMRRDFASEIFHDELYQIYAEKDKARQEIKDFFDSEFLNAASLSNKANPEAEAMLMKLADNLKNSKYRVYGRLNKSNKVLVDSIMAELSKDEKVEKLYGIWLDFKDAVLLTYQKNGAPKRSIAEESEFKSIKNKIIKYALEINCSLQEVSENTVKEMQPKETDDTIQLPEEDMEEISDIIFPDDSDEDDNDDDDNLTAPEKASMEAKKYIFKTYWTKAFKKARSLIRKNDVTESDFIKAYQLFSEESQKGNPFAKYQLASLTAKGKGAEKNEALVQEYYKEVNMAFSNMEKSIPNDLLEFYLGGIHKFGYGTEVNMKKAAEWYLKSAKLKNQFSQYAIGKMFYDGVGVSQSYKKAVRWYKESAEQGNAFAQYALGKMYYEGIEVSQSFSDALVYFENSALTIPYAAYKAAEMYRQGIGAKADKDKSDELYVIAYEGFIASLKKEEDKDGNLEYKVGKMLRDGLGISIDLIKASERFLSSSKKGNQYAQYAIGKIYLNGEGVEKNTDKAVFWLQKSADQGNSGAYYNLAKLYYDGIDIPRNYSIALSYFEIAGEEIPISAYKVGEMYEDGVGVEINHEKADFWYRKAYAGFIEMIDSDKDKDGFSAYKAGKMNIDGKGMEQDIEKGIRYMKEAAKMKNIFALFFLIKVAMKGEYEFHPPKEEMDSWIEILTVTAEKGKDFAQYALGYYYLFDSDNRNIEEAVKWLKMSEASGNEMATMLLEIARNWKIQQAQNAFMILAKRLSKMIENDYCRQSGIRIKNDSKLMRKIAEKKMAQGQRMG